MQPKQTDPQWRERLEQASIDCELSLDQLLTITSAADALIPLIAIGQEIEMGQEQWLQMIKRNLEAIRLAVSIGRASAQSRIYENLRVCATHYGKLIPALLLLREHEGWEGLPAQSQRK